MKPQLICLSLCLVSEVALADDAAPAPPAPQAATAISDRPYTLAAGKVELHTSLPISGAAGETAALLGIGAAYGATDAIQIGGDYAFEISPSADASGVLSAHVLIKLHHDEQLSAALGGSVFFSKALANENTLLFGLGVALRLRLTHEVSLYTDTNVCGGCVNVAGPVMGQAIIAHVSGETFAGFTVPVGIAVQATPQAYLYASTVVGAVLLAPQTDSYLILRDIIPIVAGGWFSASDKLDLGAALTDDLKDASNNYFVELRARMTL